MLQDVQRPVKTGYYAFNPYILLISPRIVLTVAKHKEHTKA